MATYVIKKETVSGNTRYCAYQRFIGFIDLWVYNSLEVTPEKCEEQLEKLLAYKKQKPEVVRQIKL